MDGRAEETGLEDTSVTCKGKWKVQHPDAKRTDKKLRDMEDDDQSFPERCLIRIPELSPQVNKKNSRGDKG